MSREIQSCTIWQLKWFPRKLQNTDCTCRLRYHANVSQTFYIVYIYILQERQIFLRVGQMAESLIMGCRVPACHQHNLKRMLLKSRTLFRKTGIIRVCVGQLTLLRAALFLLLIYTTICKNI